MNLCSLPVLAVLLAALLGASACAPVGPEATREPLGRDTVAALGLLRERDHRRSRAWAEGDAAARAELYTDTSCTGRHDRAMLAAYAARGLRVTGLRTQVLTATLRTRAPTRLRLEVTDRVVGAHAVGRGEPIPLPRDRPSTRMVSLRRVSGVWLVEEVTDAARRPRPDPPCGPGTRSPPPRGRPAAG